MSSVVPDRPSPQYSPSAAPRLRTAYLPSNRPTPDINVLLLGSPGVGKSTFISKIPHVRDGQLQQQPQPQPQPISSPPTNASTSCFLPPYSATAVTPPAVLARSETMIANPSTFDVSLFARPYHISLYRSTSSLFVDPFPAKIDALVLCYAIDDRLSLFNAQKYWRRVFTERYEVELGVFVPVMLVGLKRDLRSGERRNKREAGIGNEGETEHYDEDGSEYICVMPEEGLQAAREMKCDRYAECSAVTGDLMFEVLEDITRMAAGTTTNGGGFSETSCVVV